MTLQVYGDETAHGVVRALHEEGRLEHIVAGNQLPQKPLTVFQRAVGRSRLMASGMSTPAVSKAFSDVRRALFMRRPIRRASIGLT